MAFAGIFQPFARLRWIRFGLLMRDRKFSGRFSVPQTTALALLPFANRTITSVACSVFLAITEQKRGNNIDSERLAPTACVSFKHLFDSVIYMALTAGTFGG